MSVGLCLIARDYADVERVVSAYSKYFDEVYVQLNGSTKPPTKLPDNVHISTFKWCDDFAKARNALHKQVKTDLWFWMDSDDTLQNPEGLKALCQIMDAEQLDAVYLPYEYGFNDQKELIALHWRERLIRTAHPFKWVGPVHETLISEEAPRMTKDESVVLTHVYKNEAEIRKSLMRNLTILEKATRKKDPDPRDLFYLGRSLFTLEKYAESAQTLLKYTEVSGWDEQKYDAWLKIGDNLLMMDEFDKAINSIWEAIKLNPTWPDAYLKLGDLYLHMQQPGRAIEFLKVGMSKKPPQTLEITDPTMYTYRPYVSLALAFFGQARINEAKKYIDEAAKFKPKAKMFLSAHRAITEAYLEELAIRQASVLGQLVQQQGNLKAYIDGLPGFIKNDLRLRPLRVQAYPPRKWSDNSIAIFCGEQWEEWGPETLKKGMGGSEEAITYLSEELAKLGWAVTVYNQRVESLTTKAGVSWLPWETFNPEDEFDVFVAWRNPRMIDMLKIKARVKAVDMHDTPVGHQAFPDKALAAVDKIFLKGKFQKEMGAIPDDKAVIVSNGIVPEQFAGKWDKKPHKVIYASSADRGLDVLVRQVWPKVKEAVPDAELVWPYGWDSYDGMHKGDAAHGKWKWELKRDMFALGVKELGRLSHEELAKEMMTCSVWAYPTSFPEINCITALKMQAAGVRPVTTNYAALQETIMNPGTPIEDIHDKPKELEKFTKSLIDALKTPQPEDELKKASKWAVDNFSWQVIAKKWHEALRKEK